MIDSQVITFAGIALVLTLTPGADTLVVIRNVMQGKKKAGVFTSLGICSGLLVHAFFSAVGLSLIILKSAEMFEIVKLAGAAYLIFLGFQSLLKAARDKKAKVNQTELLTSGNNKNTSSMKYFLNGLLTNILNPKVALFYLALLPQFINHGEPVLTKSIVLGSIHLLFGLIWLFILTYLVDRLKKMFRTSKFRVITESLSGVVLIALGIKLAFEKR